MKKKRFDLDDLRTLRDTLAENGLDVGNLSTVIATAEQAEMDTGEDANVRELLKGFLDPDLAVTTPAADVLRTVALQLLRNTPEAEVLQNILRSKLKLNELTKV
jgi:hypothetical protein